MIRYMVKRSGKTVEFDNNKANHLIDWAEVNMRDRGDVMSCVLEVIRDSPETVTASEFNNAIINKLIEQMSWPAYLMAGRVYAFETRKQLYGKTMPTLLQLHKEMVSSGRLLEMGYNELEYITLETVLNHDRDFECPQFALNQMRNKYALKNMHTGKEFETPQFTYMRMAMALSKDEPSENRFSLVCDFYEYFSKKNLSAPTPNYTNLGTALRGYASCCLFTCDDTNASIRAAILIANDMTCNSAGLGFLLQVRSEGDPVRNGSFIHRGKKPYFDTFGKVTVQNVKNGRDGAMTAFYQCFDPEVRKIAKFRSPLTPSDQQNRDIHFAMQLNKFFVKKIARNEEVFVFNKFTAPDLYNAVYSSDPMEFEKLYLAYEANDSFKKTYLSAREIVAYSYAEAYDTGTAYLAFMDEINRHTPFKEPILQSNLCLEVTLVSKPYEDIKWLYNATDHGKGEIAMCNLAAIAVNNIDVDDDVAYFKACYLALKMIDKTIYLGEYPYPHLEFTTKQRMNAGVGIMGLATLMARKGLKYSSIEGKKFIHKLAETHMYFLIKASIAISKERGVAPWMHKTKWPDGWTPLDTYNRGIDEITQFEYYRDWASIKQELIDNGGIAHSALCNMMPGESSSKALGTSNSVYPARDLILNKRDGSNVIDWAAEDGDLIGGDYELAFDIPRHDMIDVYGIFQKFTDQAISADLYRRITPGQPVVDMQEIIQELKHMCKRGLKTRYYVNSRRPKQSALNEVISVFDSVENKEWCDNVIIDNCTDGFCKL